MDSVIDGVKTFIDTSGINLVIVLFALVFGILAIKSILKISKRAVAESKVDRTVRSLLLTVIKIVLYLALLFYILSVLGISLTGVVAAMSALTLALGLAVQDVVGSFANGLIMVATKPFKVDDYVQIGDVSGTVREITLMHTVLDTPDQVHVMLPNKTVFSSTIQNFTVNPVRRIDFEFVIDREANIESAKALLLDAFCNNEYVLQVPAPSVMVSGISDNGIKVKVRGYVDNSNYWPLNNSFVEIAYDALMANGFKVPYPQITVNSKKKEEAA